VVIFEVTGQMDSSRKCQIEDLVKNGPNAFGSSQYHCKACGTYGVLEAQRTRDGRKERTRYKSLSRKIQYARD